MFSASFDEKIGVSWLRWRREAEPGDVPGMPGAPRRVAAQKGINSPGHPARAGMGFPSGALLAGGQGTENSHFLLSRLRFHPARGSDQPPQIPPGTRLLIFFFF